MSRLEVVVRDGRGEVVPARISVRAVADGSPRWPEGDEPRYDVVRPWGEERSFASAGRCTLELAPGAYEVRAGRGPAWSAWRSVETVEAERGRALEVRLDRPDRPAMRGWRSADLHVHRRPDDLARLLRADDLDAACAIVEHVDLEPGATVRLPGRTIGAELMGAVAGDLGAGGPVDAGVPTVAWAGLEVERIMGGPGALIGLGVGAVPALDLDGWEPFDDAVADAMAAAGGLVDGEKVVWPSIPVLAAAGRLGSVELACNHLGETWSLPDVGAAGGFAPPGGIDGPRALMAWIFECYAALLGCGFRLAASGGTGAGVMPNPVGAARVYARVDGPLTSASWLAALRAGRTVSTNGPMLELEVDGAGPGARLPGPGATRRAVRLRASSPRAIERLELVADGEVVEAWPSPGEPATVVLVEAEVDLSGRAWVAARAVERQPDPMTIRFAHTSPVWTGAASRPSARARSARLVSAWLDATERQLARHEQQRGHLTGGARAAIDAARLVIDGVAAGTARA